MLTIQCPNCKRSLHAPDEGGDHRVVCPGCNVAFAVVFEGGAVRAVSTAVVDELPLSKSAEDPHPTLEDRGPPPQWIPSILPYVTNDAVARRTRRLNWTFAIATTWIFVYRAMGGVLQDEMGHFSGTKFVLVAGTSVVMAGLVTVFVGIFITPPPIETYEKGDEILTHLDQPASPAFHHYPEWVRESPASTDSDVPPTSEPRQDRPS
jgi:hypothetical protein